jgi:hypothetical protein
VPEELMMEVVLETETLPLLLMIPFEAPAWFVKAEGALGAVLVRFEAVTIISRPSVLFAAKLEVNPRFKLVVIEAALLPVPKLVPILLMEKLFVAVEPVFRELSVVGPNVSAEPRGLPEESTSWTWMVTSACASEIGPSTAPMAIAPAANHRN